MLLLGQDADRNLCPGEKEGHAMQELLSPMPETVANDVDRVLGSEGSTAAFLLLPLNGWFLRFTKFANVRFFMARQAAMGRMPTPEVGQQQP